MSGRPPTDKSLPRHGGDAADLSGYDLSGFQPMRFALLRNDARLEMRIPAEQLDALKAEARRRGAPYTRLARAILEQGIEQLASR